MNEQKIIEELESFADRIIKEGLSGSQCYMLARTCLARVAELRREDKEEIEKTARCLAASGDECDKYESCDDCPNG